MVKIRSDPNIKGINIFKNGNFESEVKVTSFADDCTYFLKDKLHNVLILKEIPTGYKKECERESHSKGYLA